MTRRAARRRPCLSGALALGCLLAGCFAREPKSTDRKIEAPPASAAPDAAGDRETPAESESESAEGLDDGAAPPTPLRQAAPPPAPAAPKSGARRREAMPRRAAPSAAERSDALQERAGEIEASDCPGAQRRRKDICDLAESICGLVERDPNVASVERHCEEAQQRCRAADARTAERCRR